jgi:NTP pyrophosphatase (non-canonical NTP hydrolase)
VKFWKYQGKAAETATYNDPACEKKAQQECLAGLMYAGLGLSGEAGEVADEIKKIYRDGEGLTADRVNAIFYELGDVLWYVAAVCNELAFDMDEVAKANLRKLDKRYNTGDDNGVA